MPTKPKLFTVGKKIKVKDQRSTEAHERQKLYDRQWRKQRTYFLQSNPLCIMCKHKGMVTSATVVDHIIPHKGNHKLFWDVNNWQPLCKTHHDSDKRKMEVRNKIGEGGVKT